MCPFFWSSISLLVPFHLFLFLFAFITACLFSILHCAVQNCGDPGQPTNGHRLQSEYSFHKVVTFRCLRGYSLQGHKKVRCKIDGTWTAATPTCIGENIIYRKHERERGWCGVGVGGGGTSYVSLSTRTGLVQMRVAWSLNLQAN